MKCPLALDAIALRYRAAIGGGYRTNCGMAFSLPRDLASDGRAASAGVEIPARRNFFLQGDLNAKIMGTIGAEPNMTSLSPADAEQLKLAFLRCREMEGT